MDPNYPLNEENDSDKNLFANNNEELIKSLKHIKSSNAIISNFKSVDRDIKVVDLSRILFVTDGPVSITILINHFSAILYGPNSPQSWFERVKNNFCLLN